MDVAGLLGEPVPRDRFKCMLVGCLLGLTLGARVDSDGQLTPGGVTALARLAQGTSG
jgi:hypothetical protein